MRLLRQQEPAIHEAKCVALKTIMQNLFPEIQHKRLLEPAECLLHYNQVKENLYSYNIAVNCKSYYRWCFSIGLGTLNNSNCIKGIRMCRRVGNAPSSFSAYSLAVY